MKITALNASNPITDYGLSKIIKIIMDTLTELGVEVVTHELSSLGIEPYKGEPDPKAAKIAEDIKTARGVIFYDASGLIAPSGVMQTFLEHLSDTGYENILENKNCLVVAVANNSFERRGLENYSAVINHLGGYDSVRIGLDSERAYKALTDDTIREIIERQAEDFYRTVNRERKFFIPVSTKPQPEPETSEFLTLEESEMLMGNIKPKVSVNEIYEKLSLDNLNESQEEDINELAQFFASKLNVQPKSAELLFTNEITPERAPTPRTKTLRQMTQSLPHYFQPQLSGGLNAVIQLNISGDESISSYISINNTECTYTEGNHSSPDLTVLADCGIWGDILKGKLTAQKAFLVGKLKVRGNFVMLNKFDQLFKIE